MGTVKTPSRRTAACAALIVAGLVGAVHAQDKSKPAVGVGRSDLSGVVSGPNRAGGGRVGYRRDAGSADEIREDRRHRRSRALSRARPAARELRRLGARLWPGRFAEGDDHGRHDEPRSHRGAGAFRQEAARYYPSTYWFALMRVPPENEFPIGKISSQTESLHTIKQGGCQSCHALGTAGMRTIPDLFRKGGEATSVEAWKERVTAGSARARWRAAWARSARPASNTSRSGPTRIEKGALPSPSPSGRRAWEEPRGDDLGLEPALALPARPRVERPQEPESERERPRIRLGREGTDLVPILDPNTHSSSSIVHPVRDPGTPSTKSDPFGPSPYWGPDRSGTAAR